MRTGFLFDERCFWHGGGNYAGTFRVGGLVQPMAAGGLPESPESRRRLRNLVEVTGLMRDLLPATADPGKPPVAILPRSVRSGSSSNNP